MNSLFQEYINKLQDLAEVLNLAERNQRMSSIEVILELAETWNNANYRQQLMQEKNRISLLLAQHQSIQSAIDEVVVLESDFTAKELEKECSHIEKLLKDFESSILLDEPNDSENTYIDIKAGSGGLEAQDWAAMLMRMYSKWSVNKDFEAQIIDIAEESKGIRQCTIQVKGSFAYGLLKGESGVHRLVRKSPFDAAGSRHTSFASVFVYPMIEKDFSIVIAPSDIRVDTFRSSGAGGQHVNKTDSAVRITHLPTNTMVQCQNDRSQHKNREMAMAQLKAKLYQLALKNEQQHLDTIEKNKSDITWGQQIRSYILDRSLIKDLRTQVSIKDVQKVLDGDIDAFIYAFLKQQKQ